MHSSCVHVVGAGGKWKVKRRHAACLLDVLSRLHEQGGTIHEYGVPKHRIVLKHLEPVAKSLSCVLGLRGTIMCNLSRPCVDSSDVAHHQGRRYQDAHGLSAQHV
eukprot:363794-Chlamydomonas_euryale.AAC.9